MDELVEACYRQLVNKDFHVDETGIGFSIAPSDLALIRSAGEKKLKEALKLALKRKTAEDVGEIYGVDPVGFAKWMRAQVDQIIEERKLWENAKKWVLAADLILEVGGLEEHDEGFVRDIRAGLVKDPGFRISRKDIGRFVSLYRQQKRKVEVVRWGS